MTGRLTVHVLDTATGRPGSGMALTLFRVAGPSREKLGNWRTNADGRCDAPLLSDAAMTAGLYEIEFDVAGWRGGPSGFYDTIPIRFRVDDPAANHHVPLILAPFGYSTYRGS